jgi:hypothetical protein
MSEPNQTSGAVPDAGQQIDKLKAALHCEAAGEILAEYGGQYPVDSEEDLERFEREEGYRVHLKLAGKIPSKVIAREMGL